MVFLLGWFGNGMSRMWDHEEQSKTGHLGNWALPWSCGFWLSSPQRSCTAAHIKNLAYQGQPAVMCSLQSQLGLWFMVYLDKFWASIVANEAHRIVTFAVQMLHVTNVLQKIMFKVFLVGADKIRGYIWPCKLKMKCLSCPKAVLENKCISSYYRYTYIYI